MNLFTTSEIDIPSKHDILTLTLQCFSSCCFIINKKKKISKNISLKLFVIVIFPFAGTYLPISIKIVKRT